MERNETAATLAPLLQSRGLRALLVASPGIMAAVAVFTATESSLAWAVVLNVAAGVIISSAVFLVVSFAARRVANDRVLLAKAVEEGNWRARTRLISIRDEDTGLYTDWYFRLRVQEEIERSLRYDLQFTIVLGRPTFVRNELDDHGTSELFYDGVRSGLRRVDLPAVLSDGSLAVLLPHTLIGAPVQRRITKSLFVAKMQAGSACFPQDGQDVEALLESAIRESELHVKPIGQPEPVASQTASS